MATWSCAYCTLVNNTSASLCEACGSQNPNLQKEKTLIPKIISKPFNNVANAVKEIFTWPSPTPEAMKPVPPRPTYSLSPFPDTSTSSTSSAPQAKRPPPPRPPPPVLPGAAAGGDRASIASSLHLDYSMNWICSTCYNINEITRQNCATCNQDRAQAAHREDGLLESTPAPDSNSSFSFSSPAIGSPTASRPNSTMSRNALNISTQSTLCSEITANVEREDIRIAAKTYNRIIEFCRKEQTPFIDDSFPHSKKSIGNLRDSENDVINGKLPAEFVWLRPQQMYTKDGRMWNWAVFRDPSANDIEQGSLGDCWLTAAMALIAERPDILEHIVLTKVYSAEGVYQIRVCVDGVWRVVLVDDFFPCNKSSKSLAFATGRKNQLWVPLIEKALAKQLGSYSRLRAGRTIEGLAMLTGAATEVLSLEDDTDVDIRWASLVSAREAGFIMGCSCGAGRKTVNAADYRKKGLLARHAYSILDVRQEEHLRLIRLRNPWGSFVWQGEWSDNWSGWPPGLKVLLLPRHSSIDPRGTFWISYKDFMEHFDSVEIAKVRSQSGWTELRVPVEMGGVYNRDTDKAVRLIVEQSTEICFTLFQSGARTEKDNVDIMVCVHKVSPLGTVGELVCRSPRKLDPSVSTGDVFLPSGQYVAVCHSLSQIGGRKIVGCLAIHSSRAVFADTVSCPPDMYTDSLVQMLLSQGVVHMTDLQGIVSRYITKDFSGLMCMVDNILEDMWAHVRVECDRSTNMLSTRHSLSCADVIPPHSRQIIMILTQYEVSQPYLVQHQLVVRISRRVALGENAILPGQTTPANPNAFHAPEFENASMAELHKAKSVFY